MSAQQGAHAIENDFIGESGEQVPSLWAALACEISTVYEQSQNDFGQPDEMAMQTKLRQAVHNMYNQLVDDEQFRQMFSECPEAGQYQSASWSRNLYTDSKIHVSLVSVYRGYDVPLHDHPGAYGLALTVSGIAKIQYANLLEKPQGQGMARVQMDRAAERLPGQVCWFYEDQRNLHRIEAKTPSAQLLVIHLPPIARQEQALYFPLEDKAFTTGETVLARRIMIKRDTVK